MRIHRGLILLPFAVMATAAQASIVYDIQVARITFNTSEVSNLSVNQGGSFNEKLDFTAGSLPLSVSSTNGHGRISALIEIVYEATSTLPVFAVGNTFTGWALNAGRVTFNETITGPGSIALGSDSATRVGAALGGSDLPFARDSVISFSQNSATYRVEKTINLSFDAGFSGPSQASIGVIEQNAMPVPEPATMLALAFGAAGVLARRRRS